VTELTNCQKSKAKTTLDQSSVITYKREQSQFFNIIKNHLKWGHCTASLTSSCAVSLTSLPGKSQKANDKKQDIKKAITE